MLMKKMFCCVAVVLAANSIYGQSRIYKDALIYDLRGNVKSCTLYEQNTYFSDDFEEGAVYEFTADGQRLNTDRTYKRDEQNRIVEISFMAEDPWTGKKYTQYSKVEYNQNGKISKKSSWIIYEGSSEKEYRTSSEYFYDLKGNVIKVINKSITGDRADQQCDYEYVSFDARGNWTERKYVDPMTLGDCVEKREIQYY